MAVCFNYYCFSAGPHIGLFSFVLLKIWLCLAFCLSPHDTFLLLVVDHTGGGAIENFNYFIFTILVE